MLHLIAENVCDDDAMMRDKEFTELELRATICPEHQRRKERYRKPEPRNYSAWAV